MKKLYEAPMVEKIRFNYRDQVVAASGTGSPVGDSQRMNGNNDTMCEIGEGFERLLNWALGDCDWL